MVLLSWWIVSERKFISGTGPLNAREIICDDSK
jgi:hypothetical protein